MTITINRNVLIFVLALGALALLGYLVGTGLGGGPSRTEVPAVVTATLPAFADQLGGETDFELPTAMPDTAPRIEVEAFKAELDAQQDVIIVDVRLAEAYAEGHIAGAVNIPEAEIVQRQAELPRDRHIVLYCA